MIQPLFLFGDWGLLVLRVALGIILIAHGWPKIRNLKATGESFTGMGFKPGLFWATVVGLTESIGGLFFIAGFLTQVAALLVAIQFLVVIFTVKRGSKLAGGYELDLLILASALALAALGSGSYGLENYWNVWLY